jgi:uncharacterized protein YdeI (YjbR/CyaY-like superfamily)
MKPIFFSNEKEFRKWLEKNYDKEKEVLVGYYKVHTGKPSMTWSQSVDQALCFGWIDGVRRSIDEESYCIRFTPRRSTSIWSAINIKKVKELTKAGLMKEAGLKAFALIKDDKSKIYAYEKKPGKLSAAYEKQFKKDKAAWNFFKEQAPSYQKVMIHWVMSAKQEKTQLSRLDKLIKHSGEKKRVL